LIPATKEILYAGCPVYTHKSKKLWVCKLNSTTAWVSEVYCSKILKREKGITIMQILQDISAFKLPYNELAVDPLDLENKPDTSVFLKHCCEKEVEELKVRMEKGKTGAWKNTFCCHSCGTQINPVKVDGNKILLSSDYRMFWFDWIDKSYMFFRTIGGN